jgi:outer membrane protein OmpA-like peptidoglycan-associated protein
LGLEANAISGCGAPQVSGTLPVHAGDSVVAAEQNNESPRLRAAVEDKGSTDDSVFSKPASDAAPANLPGDAGEYVESTTTASAGHRFERPTGPYAATLVAGLTGMGIDARVEDRNRLVLDLGDKVQFADGSVSLGSSAQAFLASLAVQLMKASPRQVLVIGHTDQQGSASVNARLSERRAEVVMQFLSDSGLSGVDLRSEGKGETEPKLPMGESRLVGSAANRRIELELLWPGERNGSDD